MDSLLEQTSCSRSIKTTKRLSVNVTGRKSVFKLCTPFVRFVWERERKKAWEAGCKLRCILKVNARSLQTLDYTAHRCSLFCLFHPFLQAVRTKPTLLPFFSFLVLFIKEKSSTLSIFYHVTDALRRAGVLLKAYICKRGAKLWISSKLLFLEWRGSQEENYSTSGESKLNEPLQ